VFYFASGSILSGAIYLIIESRNSLKEKAKCWPDQNIIIDGKLVALNLVAFLIYCLLYLAIQNFAFLTMVFAG
jgi:hypothetical protein